LIGMDTKQGESMEFMTPQECADTLKVNVQTVRRWCRSGLGRQIGDTYRITRDDIDEFFPKDTGRGIRFERKAAAR